MRQLGVVLAVALLALATAATATAQRAVQIKRVDASFSFDPFFAEACGFEVTGSVSGTANVTLFLDASGAIIREIDTFPAARVTFSGNGKSFSFPGAFFMMFHTVYPEGATVGAPAIARVTGLFGHVKGIGADAGQDVLTGTVVELAPEGFPIVNFTDLVLSHGNRESGETITEAACTVLGDP